jgi:hypothetical protein
MLKPTAGKFSLGKGERTLINLTELIFRLVC